MKPDELIDWCACKATEGAYSGETSHADIVAAFAPVAERLRAAERLRDAAMKMRVVQLETPVDGAVSHDIADWRRLNTAINDFDNSIDAYDAALKGIK